MFALASLSVAAGATLPPGFSETQITGLSSPTAMTFAHDGRLFVCQQTGALRVIKNGALLATPFMTLTVNSSGERGLLGVAFDPGFATNNFIYVYYTVNTAPIHNRVSRFTANGDLVVPGSEVVILDLNNLSGATNHNGGAIHFGPDGKLYIAVGENANSANSQTFANLLGKMLRINTDPANVVPADNPYFNDPAVTGINKAIWSLGLRNPFTFGFQNGTGRMLLNDVGQGVWEEINEGIGHSNYGWPNCEGPDCSSTPIDYRAPLYVYNHSTGTPTGCAIVGGAFYNPITTQFPAAYVGKYFFADLCGGYIRYIDPTTTPPIPSSTNFATGVPNPVDLQVSNDGSLWYLSRGGATGFLGRIQFPAGQVAPMITQHPQSQTVAVNQPVTFNCSADGSTPLNFQWQRNMVDINGATGTSYTIPSVAASDDGALFRCIASNAFGSAASNNATLTVPTNQPPNPSITTPVVGTFYNAGDTINYSGSATDNEDPSLPASAFTWSVVFHHDTHTHPFIPPTSGSTSGMFTIPTIGETAASVWYRIHLVVTDSGGLSSESTRDIFPNTSTINFTTNPAGLAITLDGQQHADGYSELNVVNMQRTLGVPASQTLNGSTYNFVSWSDGGAQTHNINVPAGNSTYTAIFVRAASVREVLISEFRLDGPNGTSDEFLELYNNTNAPITVSSSDGSAGWAVALAFQCALCDPSGHSVSTYFVIPNGTVIPARGHFLYTNVFTDGSSVYRGYSLKDYGGTNQATGDATTTLAGSALVASDTPWEGFALFTTSNPANWSLANRLDAVSSTINSLPLFAAGNGINYLSDYYNSTVQYSWLRRMESGFPQDTDDSANDFLVISNVGSFVTGNGVPTLVQAILGAPGPENLGSQIQRNSQIKASLIEPQQLSTNPPNRVRDATANGCGGPNCALGTLDIRRRFKNNTGAPVTRLRFRIVDITTLNTPNPGGAQADLRLLTSSDVTVSTSLGNLTVRGAINEEPPSQSNGGGLNSSAVINLPGFISPGATVNVRFVLGVQAAGRFRFLINVEALP